jgi:AraC-like DNA-binding protein
MYAEVHPGAALERAVECRWRMDAVDGLEHWVRPDGCIDIVYSRESGLRAVGAMTAAQRFAMPARSLTIGVRFHPGMAKPFLRVPPPELTDRIVALEDLWGPRARELERRLEAAPDSITLASALTAPPAPDPVKRAIWAITTSRGAIDLDWVADQAGLSPRQFRRRCFEESGLSPKLLCRILRFRHACALANTRRENWASIALAAGYFDQAHLIRDFHEFTAQAPMSVFSNTPPPRPGHNRA